LRTEVKEGVYFWVFMSCSKVNLTFTFTTRAIVEFIISSYIGKVIPLQAWQALGVPGG
jgi:hypothetical protein